VSGHTPYAVKQHVAANVPTPAPVAPDRHTAAPRDVRIVALRDGTAIQRKTRPYGACWSMCGS